MTKVIARVHLVHLINADWAPGGRQPSDQANSLGLRVRRKLAATVHIHHRHCYYYSARKLIFFNVGLTSIKIQICVLLFPSTVSVTLPAFAAWRRRPTATPLLLNASACYRSISPARRALSSKPASGRCYCRWMGRTDGRALDLFTDTQCGQCQ